VSEHEKDTAFLRRCILYDDSVERHKLEESITQLQRNERSVRRAVGLMVLLVALALASLCYSAIFLTTSPSLIIKVFSALGVGSLICMLAFGGLGLSYRKELDQRREECRRVALKLLEARLEASPRNSQASL